VNQVLEFTVTPITIQSGDFFVGVTVTNPIGVFPAAMDTSSSSRQRSYVGTDRSNFTVVDATGIGPGNFLFRARVDVGGN